MVGITCTVAMKNHFDRQVKVQFGIRLVPKTVAEALKIDKTTGTDFWKKAVKKGLAKVKIA